MPGTDPIMPLININETEHCPGILPSGHFITLERRSKKNKKEVCFYNRGG